MKRLTISHKSLITKFSIISLLIVFAVGGIATINLLAFFRVKDLLLTMVEEDVSQIVRNAGMGRALSDIFSESQLLIGSFTERKDTIQTEGEKLVASLEEQITLLRQPEEGAQGVLEGFSESLQNIFEQCFIVNEDLDTIQAIETELTANLETLDRLVVDKTLVAAIEGSHEESVAIEQLGSMLSGYREIFYQAIMLSVRSKQAHLRIRTTREDYEEAILSLLDELHTGLGATTGAWEDIQPLIAQTMEAVERYKDTVITLHSDMLVFQSRLGILEGRQKQVLAAIEILDVQIARKTRGIGENVLVNTQKSINMTLFLSGIITLVLVFVEIYMIRSIRPLKLLARVANQLSEGDIRGHPKTLRNRQASDEIGTLTEAFTKLVHYNQDMADIATAISQGDLSFQIRLRSERDVLGQAFLNMSSYLNDLAMAATAIAGGNLDQDIRPKAEQDVLGNAFRTMALHLHENFDVIETQLGEIQRATEGRKRLLGELQKKNEALQQEIVDRKFAEEAAKAANLAKSEFLAKISHELRTPLNIILGMAQTMLGNNDVPLKEREHLSSILQSGDHLLLLVNRLIEASRLKKNHLSFEERQFDFDRILQKIHNAEHQRVKMQTELPDAEAQASQELLLLRALRLLPEELPQALQNAVEVADFENAMKSIQQIHPHNARLAETLEELVGRYQFERLYALLEEREAPGE